MTSETELFGKDSIKLNILKELTEGEINISLSLGGGVYQDYLSQIHREGSRMQVLGKFNLSESTRNTVLIRVQEYEEMMIQGGIVTEENQLLMPYMRIILALTDHYAAICMNPKARTFL